MWVFLLLKLLVFDLGHVLIDFEWMEVCYAFSERCARPTHEILEAFSRVGELGYEKGKISTQEFLGELNTMLSADMSEAEFRILWNTSFRENEAMSIILEGLKRSHELCLLSNTNQCHYDFIQQSFDVERNFDNVVLSYEVGHAKPAREIYRAVVEQVGVPASQCLFVDDLEINVKAALDFGMNAILFTDPEKLRLDLTAHGIKV